MTFVDHGEKLMGQKRKKWHERYLYTPHYKNPKNDIKGRMLRPEFKQKSLPRDVCQIRFGNLGKRPISYIYIVLSQINSFF